MDELFKFMTPENFAMLITIYLLVRFEKAIEKLEKGIGKFEQSITQSLNRNTKLLTVLLYNQDDTECQEAARQLLSENRDKDLEKV